MYRRNPVLGILTLLIALPLWTGTAQAAKVTLDPSNWNHPDGASCIQCHKKSSTGLYEQWHGSAHAKAKVNCMDCHQAKPEDPDAFEHKGNIISVIVSPKDCSRCHPKEYKQQQGSTHAEAALLIKEHTQLTKDVVGDAVLVAGCAQCHGSEVKVNGDGTLDPDTWPNTGIGRINPDGSRGSCSSCHGRHSFSKAQAREPAACSRCHNGPDSPDKEIYDDSKHGMIYVAKHDQLNMDGDSWAAGVDYTAAPTCVTCHMGATSGLKSTHNVSMRNVWNLNMPVSERQYLVIFEDGVMMDMPATQKPPKKGETIERHDGTTGVVKAVAGPERRRKAMMKVCVECHGKPFVQGFMRQFDNVVKLYNDKFGRPASDIMRDLYDEGHLTKTPFDEPIEFTYWELYHDEGARARHGASMASPNHTWWEGMYLVTRNFYSKFLPQVLEVAGEEAGNAIIERHVKSREAHKWLSNPDRDEKILRGWLRTHHGERK